MSLREIQKTYENLWGPATHELLPKIEDTLLRDFPEVRILVFAPSHSRNFWIYATLGLSEVGMGTESLPEAHVYAEQESEDSVLALSAFFEYPSEIHFGMIFPLEKNPSSKHTHLLATFPYPDGEGFPEIFSEEKEILFLWLLPITDAEVEFIRENGYPAFEEKYLENESENEPPFLDRAGFSQ
jgi:hypothetical protein